MGSIDLCSLSDFFSPLLQPMDDENEKISPKLHTQSPQSQSKRPLYDLLYTSEVSSCLSYLIFVLLGAITCHVLLGPLPHHLHTSPEKPDSILGRENYVLSVYSLGIIIAVGVVTGYLAQLGRLPSLLGMLLTGIVLRNVTGSIVNVSVIKEWSVVLRRTAFVVILLRGGLSLDANAVRRLKGACLRLSIIPCTVETFVVAIAAKIIFGMDIIFGIALGAVLAAVSPAVVIPALLDATKNGYGVRAGVPSLVIAAASLDDVYAITIFSLAISLVFPSGNSVLLTILGAPAEVFAGAFFGAVMGFVLHVVPRKTAQNVHLVRLALLFAFSTAFLFGTIKLRVDGAGAIGVLVAAFVSGHEWKKEGELPEEEYLAIMWHHAFQPLLFGLIGLELSFDTVNLRCWSCIPSYCFILAVFASGLTIRERFFVAIAWMPKATVQAALAPVVLETAQARASSPHYYIENGTFILTMAILSILITAPLGALAIRLATPALLKKDGACAQGVAANDVEFEMS
ncbi:transporter, CPA2 family [Ancylostoma caninum]|uniref:Transporter, CPA2 family n=1 Tax=Ancylostoma caninum TaxID=29170 RepID=A0A368FH22_ANCCA|nr:transporter, CPA2 family [Ancylostoma caninum]